MVKPLDYYQLVKPGIVYGNAIHFVAGALLAATIDWSWMAAVGGLIGLVSIVASACAVNNYIDRDIDRRMKRTRSRPSVTGAIAPEVGVSFAASLAILGFMALALTTNPLTVVLGIVAYVMYAFVYTLSKRRTVHHTLIGTIPGALPAVAGYTAMTNQVDLAASLLFFLIVVWQLGHFYAIGVYRKDEYRSAGVPMLTGHLSMQASRRLIVGSIFLYVATASIFSYAVLSTGAGIILTLSAIWWLLQALSRSNSPREWGRSVFKRSLVLALILPFIMLLEYITSSFS